MVTLDKIDAEQYAAFLLPLARYGVLMFFVIFFILYNNCFVVPLTANSLVFAFADGAASMHGMGL